MPLVFDTLRLSPSETMKWVVHQLATLPLANTDICRTLRCAEAYRIDSHTVDQHQRLGGRCAAQKQTRSRTWAARARNLCARRELQQTGQIGRGRVGDVLLIEQ